MDGEIVNLFRVLRDHGPDLQALLELTPYARNEFVEAWKPSDDPMEQARRTVIRSFMGFASASVTLNRFVDTARGNPEKTGFRANSNRAGTTPAHDWKNYPGQMPTLIKRLQGVVIENREAVRVMQDHDTPQTLHYVDPPYVPESRDGGSDYRHEMTIEQHRELAACLNALQGMVVLSGYPSALYEELFSGWKRHTMTGPLADGAGKRTEVLWTRNIETFLL